MHYFILTFTLLILIISATAVENEKKVTDIIYEKVISDNLKEAEKSFNVYQKSLRTAESKIIKSLEDYKLTFNDTKKGKWTVSERAAMIAEIDLKIIDIKNKKLHEIIVDTQFTSVLGVKEDIKDLIPGNWELHRDSKAIDAALWVGKFNEDGTAVVSGAGIGKWVLSGRELTVSFGGNIHVWIMTDQQVILGIADGIDSSMKKVDYKKKK